MLSLRDENGICRSTGTAVDAFWMLGTRSFVWNAESTRNRGARSLPPTPSNREDARTSLYDEELFPVPYPATLTQIPIRLRSRYSDRLRAPLKPGTKANYLNPVRSTRRLGGTILITLTHSLTRL